MNNSVSINSGMEKGQAKAKPNENLTVFILIKLNAQEYDLIKCMSISGNMPSLSINNMKNKIFQSLFFGH